MVSAFLCDGRVTAPLGFWPFSQTVRRDSLLVVRCSYKAAQPQLLTRRASSTIIRLGQKNRKHVGGV
jgi:hypothetical protein